MHKNVARSEFRGVADKHARQIIVGLEVRFRRNLKHIWLRRFHDGVR
jgi:hypothetical protein